VEILMRAGCNTNLKNAAGQTAADMVSARLSGPETVKRVKWLASKPFVGVVVELAGLVGGAEHNGKLAAVRRFKADKQRYELELLESGRRLDVRPANFVLTRLPAGTEVVTAGQDDPMCNGIRGSVGSTLTPHGFARGDVRCAGWDGLWGWVRKHGEWPCEWHASHLARSERQLVPLAEVATRPVGPPWPATAAESLLPLSHLALVTADLPPVPPGTSVEVLTTGLSKAVYEKDTVATWRYLAAGADPNAVCPDGGGTFTSPLTMAAAANSVEMVLLLLEAGARTSQCAGCQGTAFHIACWYDCVDCVIALVKAGCDVGAKDATGCTGKEIAQQRGSVAVWEWLEARDIGWRATLEVLETQTPDAEIPEKQTPSPEWQPDNPGVCPTNPSTPEAKTARVSGAMAAIRAAAIRGQPQISQTSDCQTRRQAERQEILQRMELSRKKDLVVRRWPMSLSPYAQRTLYENRVRCPAAIEQ
jgi:hypothetical protein